MISSFCGSYSPRRTVLAWLFFGFISSKSLQVETIRSFYIKLCQRNLNTLAVCATVIKP